MQDLCQNLGMKFAMQEVCQGGGNGAGKMG